ncbi:phage terminase large subunit family protein [Enterobacter pseudoroggenkampii]|uniref:phage terminase large subunit family protein n=1 Tax=Enterobacter pseudoroggenkampii TaxID=2996112 RepID=UPI0022640363|nr:terminase family protein [Enterobacter pseudoroggenkampii]MCX8289108.1 terminase family protein [Enterobacter pseudoroggenkampii]
MSDSEFKQYVDNILSNPATTEEQKQELYYLVKERQEHRKYNALEYFIPHKWQEDFYKAGKNHRYRYLTCCNRGGKSLSASIELGYHLTGKYPKNWAGKRFNKPIKAWAIGNTTSQVTEILQTLLVGTNTVKGDLTKNTNFGSGSIPRDDLIISSAQRNGAQLESISVRHYNKYGEHDGDSEIAFKSLSAGQESFAGATLDVVWEDEMLPETPASNPLTLYTELLQRVRTTKGLVIITATPDFGVNGIYKKFISKENPQEYMLSVSMYDCPHFTPEEVAQAHLDIPKYLQPAKIYGIPDVTSGAVYPYDFDSFTIDPIPLDPSWKYVVGLDIGWHDPTCAVWIAQDSNNNFIVFDTYSKAEDVPAVHAQAIRSRGKDIPVILPPDSVKSATTNGDTAYRLYRELLPDQAEYDTFYNFRNFDGSKNTRREAGFDLIRAVMREDRLKIFSTCSELIKQLRSYAVKNGRIQEKGGDDYCDAFRYGIISLLSDRGKARNQNNEDQLFSNNNNWNPHNLYF